jgi:O-antigen/teichoic acid export membrane protein
MAAKKGNVITSLFWSFFERVGSQGISLLISIILARLVSLEDYGVIAAAQIFIQLATVFVSGGFGNALIQKKDATDKDFSTMFIFNIVFSVSIYGIIYIFAPNIVTLLNKSYDYDLLIKVIRVLGLGVVLSGYESFYRALLTKQLYFKKLFKLCITGMVVSATVGITMAYKGYGVWALVTQSLLTLFINCILFTVSSKWKPKFYFSFRRFKPMFLFGLKLMLSSLFITIYTDLTSLAIGNRYSGEDLAFYKKGVNFPRMLVLNIITAINTALFPVMSKMDDPDELKALVRKFNRLSAFIITPMMLGFAAVGGSFIEIVLTEKWLPCVIFLQITCINYAIQPIGMSSLQYLKASGKATEYLVLDIIRKIVGVALLGVAIVLNKGIWLIALSEVASNFIAIFINMYPGKKHINYKIKEQISDILPKFILSGAMFGIVFAINSMEINIYLKVVLQIFIGIAVYLSGAKIFKMKELNEIVLLAKGFLKKS